MLKMIEAHDGVEDQRIASNGFAAIERVAGEEKRSTAAEVRGYNRGVFGERVAMIEQTGYKLADLREIGHAIAAALPIICAKWSEIHG